MRIFPMLKPCYKIQQIEKFHKSGVQKIKRSGFFAYIQDIQHGAKNAPLYFCTPPPRLGDQRE